MRREIVLSTLLCACAHRGPVVQHASVGVSTPILGTWRGALDASPVTLRVFGSDEQGFHAELDLAQPDGDEHWVLFARPDDTDGLTFAAAGGMPTCRASVDTNRLIGECEVAPGGRKRQWLVVRL